MTELVHKKFSFDVELQEAYKDSDGTMHVVGIASDDLEDRTGDRMSAKAVRQMADQAMKNRLPLLDNHRSTFGFGETHSASAMTVKEDGKTVTRLVIDFALKSHYPQSKDLFDEVLSGNSKKQLSIGGFLNLKNKKAVLFEENADGKLVRVLDDIHLEHVATTRPKMAAVSRTKFISAIIKDVFGDDSDLPEDWRRDAGEKIAVAVLSGSPEGTVKLKDETEIGFEVSHRHKEGEGKPEVIVVMVDRTQSPETLEAEHTVTQGIDTKDTKDQAAPASTDAAKGEETTSSETTKQADTTADAAVEKTGEGDNASIKEGLAVLSRIGKAFGPADEKDDLPEEIVELTKSWDKLRTSGELCEKSMEAIRRIMAGMARLLNEEVGDEKPETDSAFTLKSEDIAAIAAAVAKAMKPEASGKEGTDGEEAKTNEDIIKVFEGAFTGMTTEVAKGLGDMAEGFKGMVSKEIGEIKTHLETSDKSSNERLERLEKAAGVRQSAPAQDSAVAVGAQTSDPEKRTESVSKSRRPDSNNVFRGAFDVARSRYLSTHR